MTIAQLRAFLAAMELGTFTAAAEKLETSQASISELVARLEDTLGTPLFTRGGRKLVATRAAIELRPHAHDALAALEDGMESVRAMGSLHGGVSTFGVMRNAGYYDLADLAQTFHARYPKVKIRLVGLNSGFVAESIAAGEIECGLVILPVAVEGLEIKPLFKDEVFYVSTTRPRSAGDVTIEEMSQANLILYDAHTGWKDPTRKQILDRAKLAGVVIDPAIEVEHVETAISLVASGAGDSLVSRSIMDTPSFPLNVRTFKFDPPLYDTIALAQRTDSIISPATKKFAELAANKLLKYQKARNLMDGSEDVS